MTEITDRDRALKLGLLLALIEGWVSIASLAGRLHLGVQDVERTATWLVSRGYAEMADAVPISYRWRGDAEYEALWALLIPNRRCPIRFCGKPRGTRDAGVEHSARTP